MFYLFIDVYFSTLTSVKRIIVYCGTSKQGDRNHPSHAFWRRKFIKETEPGVFLGCLICFHHVLYI